MPFWRSANLCKTSLGCSPRRGFFTDLLLNATLVFRVQLMLKFLWVLLLESWHSLILWISLWRINSYSHFSGCYTWRAVFEISSSKCCWRASSFCLFSGCYSWRVVFVFGEPIHVDIPVSATVKILHLPNFLPNSSVESQFMLTLFWVLFLSNSLSDFLTSVSLEGHFMLTILWMLLMECCFLTDLFLNATLEG